MRFFFAISFLIAAVSEARTLTWNEAVQLAQQNSLEYQSALSNYKSVEELEISGVSGFLPKLSASANGTHSGAPGTDSTQAYTAQLSLSQNLFSGLSDINNYFLKKTNTRSALATFNSVKARLSQELKQAYAEVYYIQDYKKLAADILKRRIENNANVKLQYNVGRENKGSVMLSQSYVDSAEYDVLKTSHDEEVSVTNLKRILGINSDEAITVSDNIVKEELKNTRPDFNLIASEHPDVLVAQYEEAASLYNTKITRSQFLPSLDLSGSYSYTGTTFFPDQDRWSIGLTLSIPLFEGFKTVASYRSLKSKYEGNQYSAKNTILKITNTVKQAYYAYVEAVQKEKIDEGFRQAAILRAEVARNKYKNGFLTFEEWDIIETDLISRQKEVLNSEKNRIIKQSAWEQAQGIGVF